MKHLIYILGLTAVLNAQENGKELNLNEPEIKNNITKTIHLNGTPEERKRENEIRKNGGILNPDEVPVDLQFKRQDLKKGRALIAGRFSMKTGFGGKRIVFHTFDGYEVSSSSFKREDLEKQLIEKLREEKTIPVKIVVNLTEGVVSSGHSTSTYRKLEYLYSYEIVSADSICEAAKKNAHTEEECAKFKANFENTVKK